MKSSNSLYYTERGTGPALLLLHGLMIPGGMFDDVVGPLSYRHRVIVPDLRGYGSSRNLPPPYTAAQLASDVDALLDELGISSATILGYSHGGAIAQQLALDHPARCSRLVLAFTYSYNMVAFHEKIEGRLAPLLIRLFGIKRFARFGASVGMKQLPRISVERIVELMSQQDLGLMLTAWREAMAFDSRQRLSEIRCPTLIIAGGRDTALPLHHAKMLHAGIAGSRLELIEDAGHAFIWEKPDDFVRIVIEFIG